MWIPGAGGHDTVRRVKKRGPSASPVAAIEAHPSATLVVDARLGIALANAAARRLLGARKGRKLADALPCVEGRSPGGCAPGSRCGGCAIHRCVVRALAGERARARGFVLRSGPRGEPADLHLVAAATPLGRAGARRAVLALDDANAILSDPALVAVCEGCGRVQDEEGGWHVLHRYLQDRLGIEIAGPLCERCEGRGR
jgi:hypothetical protein